MRELFLTGNDSLCSSLTAGNQSEWFPVGQNNYHTFYLKFTGISTNVKFSFEHCPILDAEPHTDFTCKFGTDGELITVTADGVGPYYFNGVRTGFVRLNFDSASGGTPSLDCYYFGGR